MLWYKIIDWGWATLDTYWGSLNTSYKCLEIQQLEVESEDDIEFEEEESSSNRGGFWSSLSSLVGTKQLNISDIDPVISKMRDHLISKNVAADVARYVFT